jgi:hypothetical protein
MDQQVLNLIQKILDRVMGKTQNILQPAETMHENLVEGKVSKSSRHSEFSECLLIFL